jgi:hypothetical protein
MSTLNEIEWKLTFLKNNRLPNAKIEDRPAIESEIENLENQLKEIYDTAELISINSEESIHLVTIPKENEDESIDADNNYYRDRFNRFGTIAATVVYFVNAWNPTAPIL